MTQRTTMIGRFDRLILCFDSAVNLSRCSKCYGPDFVTQAMEWWLRQSPGSRQFLVYWAIDGRRSLPGSANTARYSALRNDFIKSLTVEQRAKVDHDIYKPMSMGNDIQERVIE